MNQQPSSAHMRKQDGINDDQGGGRDPKTPAKTLNRVPRACNACRKQKMRCEGADNPPCRRCRNTGIECLFEKPSREATLTGEAGLERIRSLEANVMDIRHGQSIILNALADLQTFLRVPTMHQRPPPEFMQPYAQPPPGPSAPSPTQGTGTPSASRPRYPPGAPMPGGPPPVGGEYLNAPPPPHMAPPGMFPPGFPMAHPQGSVLPPFSSIQGINQQPEVPANVSSVRYEGDRPIVSGKRPNDDASGLEAGNGELPASGLVAPWEVLRGLADVAIERAAKENGDGSDSRPRSPADGQDRPTKRRKVRHKASRIMTFPDVVTKGIIIEAEARDLFRIYFHGCSTFLPVFDSKYDTYDALHQRSPFAVNAICMVAARCRDGGGKPSDVYLQCLEEVQATSCASLFVPVFKVEAVQSMLLVSGWSDNGWLSGGHAVRMALELSLHMAWPQLLQRINDNRSNTAEDRDLIVASRTWFALYLYEHQLSYGTGRPAILKNDASILGCRALLQHPLAIEDDMRLVSTAELMTVRERLQSALSTEGPVRESDILELRRAQLAFQDWFATWDTVFSQKYEESAFYRQSLKVQKLHAELFHNTVVLRDVDGPEDVQKMQPAQRELAVRSIHACRQCLDITNNSDAYREGLKYAVHYTHATATFTASLLLRLARLFPTECDTEEARQKVERLAQLMAEVPGKRYALTLQLMLKRFSSRRTPEANQDRSRAAPSGPVDVIMDAAPAQAMYSESMSWAQQHQLHPGEADQIWRGLGLSSGTAQVPVWISDQSLGGPSFIQHGMNAFLLPANYLPPVPHVW